MLQKLTGNTGQKLPGETLYLTAWERDKGIRLEKVEDALSEQIRHDADVVSKVEAISQVDAFVTILSVVVRKS